MNIQVFIYLVLYHILLNSFNLSTIRIFTICIFLTPEMLHHYFVFCFPDVRKCNVCFYRPTLPCYYTVLTLEESSCQTRAPQRNRGGK